MGMNFQQGSDQQLEIHELGSALSNYLPCKTAVWPTFDKNLFHCACKAVIPVWMVRAAVKTGDWSLVDEKHKEEVNAKINPDLQQLQGGRGHTGGEDD